MARADQLAKGVGLDQGEERTALEKKVSGCFANWYAQQPARDHAATHDKVRLRTFCGMSTAAVLIASSVNFEPQWRTAALTAFELDISCLMALLPLSMRIVWSSILDMPKPGPRSVWRALRWLWSEDAELPRDGMVLLVAVAARMQDISQAGAPSTTERIELSRRLAKAARLIIEDRKAEGSRLPQRLLSLRRRRLAAVAGEVESQAAVLLGLDGPASLEVAHESLLALLRAWVRDELEQYAAKLPEPAPRAHWHGRARALVGLAVLFVAGFVAVVVGGPVAAGGGATAMIMAGLTVAGAPSPLEMAKMITGK
jgi:hypothetical protein